MHFVCPDFHSMLMSGQAWNTRTQDKSCRHLRSRTMLQKQPTIDLSSMHFCKLEKHILYSVMGEPYIFVFRASAAYNFPPLRKVCPPFSDCLSILNQPQGFSEKSQFFTVRAPEADQPRFRTYAHPDIGALHVSTRIARIVSRCCSIWPTRSGS